MTSTPTSAPTWTARRVIAATLVALAVALTFLLVYRFRMVVLIIFTGVVVSMAIAPGVEGLHRLGLPRSMCVILIYLILLTALVAFIYLVIPEIARQVSAVIPKLTSYYQDFRNALTTSPFPIVRQIAWQLPATLAVLLGDPAPAQSSGTLDGVTQALNTAGNVVGVMFTLFAVLLIGFYWTLESERALRSFLLPIPSDKRDGAREIIAEVAQRVGGYVRGQGVLAITIGVAALVVYVLIGLPSVLALALMAGLFELIPVIGPTLGAIPPVLVALAVDPSKVLLVIAASALIQFLENNLLAPRVMHKTVGVNPVVTLLAIIAFGSLFGFGGLLLAIPMAAVIQILLDRSVLHPTVPVLEVPAGRDRLSKLRYDAQEFVLDVRKVIRRKEVGGNNPTESDAVEDAIEAIALDLDSIIAESAQGEASS